MKIHISGASGYIGTMVSAELIKNGHEVFSIPRKLLYETTDKLAKTLSDSDVVINFAGAPILKRWTKSNKSLIYTSRIETTSNLVAAIKSLPQIHQPKKFISASAIGIYKSGIQHNETSTDFDKGFVGKVVKDWEATLNQLPDTIQKNIFRIGLVVGKEAKTIKNLVIPFKLGLGATIGNGNQAFPFVHENDVTRAFVWAVEKLEKKGTFNLVAPENISNKDFTKTFAKKLKRPAFFSIPGFLLKLTLGEAAVLLLESPEINPEELIKQEFQFDFPTIDAALSEILA